MKKPTTANLSSQLHDRARSLLGRSFARKVNCFSVSRFYFEDSPLTHLSADEMLNFTASHFEQIQKTHYPALQLVWSRRDATIPSGEINVAELAQKKPGFPFGLVLEHSFVEVEPGLAFQKPDPSITSLVDVINTETALQPYVDLLGFEVTMHRARF